MLIVCGRIRYPPQQVEFNAEAERIMMKRGLVFSMIVLLCLPLHASYAVLFQWTDESGVKHYSTEGAPRQYEAETSNEFDPDSATHKFARFVRIPAGRYDIGSPPAEDGRDAVWEKQRPVTIAKDFYLMTTEVTRQMWERVMGHQYWGNRTCDKCPATGQSIDRIRYFIKQLNLEEGMDIYRLPTEEEWEIACRAGSTTPFHTGDCLLTHQANIMPGFPPYGNCQAEEIKRTRLSRVGRYTANAWGLMDMHGNAAEVCTTDDPEKKVGYVTKGGSFVDMPRRCRSAAVGTFNLKLPGESVGFRLAKVLR
jgi:formylglycine-generating enzyme required for sulfatase activity